VNQFKSKILPLQRPVEKEDIGAVVFNDQDSGRGFNSGGFQSSPHIVHYLSTHQLGVGHFTTQLNPSNPTATCRSLPNPRGS
jgi:hypothetical protein